jgi:hypothetical protein
MSLKVVKMAKFSDFLRVAKWLKKYCINITKITKNP